MSTTPSKFSWMPSNEGMWLRLVESPPVESPPVESPPVESPPVESPPAERPLAGGATSRVEATLLPQALDEKLRESTLVIAVFHDNQETFVYRGPYKEQVTLALPFSGPEVVSVQVWALHRPSGTFLSWNSLHSWRLAAAEAVSIKLYTGYDEGADGWLQVTPIETKR